MKETTNYQLKKIELTDSPPDITVHSDNFDIIDTQLKKNADDLIAHKADYASMQFGSRPYVSTASKTYYIDEINGSDSNDGESAVTAFATFGKFITKLPIFLKHVYTVRIVGNYSGSDFTIEQLIAIRPGYLTIIGDTENADNHVISNAAYFYTCMGGTAGIDGYFYNATAVFLKALKFTGPLTGYASNIFIKDCKPQPPGGTSVSVTGGDTTVMNCDFGTDIVHDCIQARHFAHVLSMTNSGNATRYGLSAYGGIIQKFGSQPTGDTANEDMALGGVIR